MKKLFKIVLLSSIPLVMFSCYYDEFPEKIVNEDEVVPPGTDISFLSDIRPIFVEYDCASCHSPSTLGQNPNLTPGAEYNALVPTYVKALDPDNSRLYTQLAVNGHRSVDNLSIDKIKVWIEQGAKNN